MTEPNDMGCGEFAAAGDVLERRPGSARGRRRGQQRGDGRRAPALRARWLHTVLVLEMVGNAVLHDTASREGTKLEQRGEGAEAVQQDPGDRRGFLDLPQRGEHGGQRGQKAVKGRMRHAEPVADEVAS